MIYTLDLLARTDRTRTALQVALLGPPTVSWDGQPFVIARRQARALFYRIAAAAHPIPREQLGFLLWPDSPEATARRNLTVLLSQIRSALPLPDLLITGDDAIGFNHGAAETDTATLASLTSQTITTSQLDSLADALRHYRGPFLDGFSLSQSAEFETWASHERQVWERRYLDAQAVLVEGYTATGAYHAAIDAAQRALGVDELAEDMHRHLMSLYSAIGDRAAAMRQFERCVVVLEHELGVGPLPETRAVYEAVRDRRYGDNQAGRHGGRETGSIWVTSTPALPQAKLHNLPVTSWQIPAPSHPLIGRSAEVAAARATLLDSDTRMLTFCGPGGSGKTRLALQVAWEVYEQFDDGVLFVPLAPLHDPNRVVDAIAQACGLHATGTVALAEEVGGYLREKKLLLILDNFEHLLPAAVEISDLLAAAPSLRIVVTSRTLLNLSGEQSFPVQPLPLPDLAQLPPLADLAAQPTVALLLARTRAHTPAFDFNASNAADIAAICVRLDGLPLAIELAAARLKALSPQALLKRLDHRLSVLDRGPCDLPDRQRTLRATIEWSYRLLDSPVQRLFEQLAVFAGGWTLEAAEDICTFPEIRHKVLDGLQTLLDSHLIVIESSPAGQPRFGMLETIREYALERLRARGAERTVRHRHATSFCYFAERWAPGFHSAEIATVEREYHNICAALHSSMSSGEQEQVARLVSAIFWYWDTRGLVEEAQFWIAQALRRAQVVPYPWRTRVKTYASYIAYRAGRPAEAQKQAAMVIDDTQAPAEDRALALRVLGLSTLQANNIVSARPHFEHALGFARVHQLPDAIAAAQFNLGLILVLQGELTEAEAMLWESCAPWEQRQHPRYIGVALLTLGYIAVVRGERERSRKLLQQGLQQLIQARETTYLLYGLLACACFAALFGESHCAATLFGAGTHYAANVRLTFLEGVVVLVRRHIEQAHNGSTPAAFDCALQQGQSLSLDEAVELAQSLLVRADAQEERFVG